MEENKDRTNFATLSYQLGLIAGKFSKLHDLIKDDENRLDDEVELVDSIMEDLNNFAKGFLSLGRDT